jgi:hypothetical protein
MFGRCKHPYWNTISCDFYEPASGPIKLRGYSVAVLMKFTLGVTVVVQQCEACGKVKTEEFNGEVVIPPENRVRSS